VNFGSFDPSRFFFAKAQHLHLIPGGLPGFDLQKILDPNLGAQEIFNTNFFNTENMVIFHGY
jgi:hypothetical protein